MFASAPSGARAQAYLSSDCPCPPNSLAVHVHEWAPITCANPAELAHARWTSGGPEFGLGLLKWASPMEEQRRKLAAEAQEKSNVQTPLSILRPMRPQKDYESPRDKLRTELLIFKVDKYALPKFEVKAIPPAFLTFKHTSFSVQVRAYIMADTRCPRQK